MATSNHSDLEQQALESPREDLARILILCALCLCASAHAQTLTILSGHRTAVQPKQYSSGYSVGGVNPDGSVSCVVDGSVEPSGNSNDYQRKNGITSVGCGSIANGPLAVQYVTANGNDNNDGLTWGTAKATIYKAMQSLPGGSPGVVGQGTIYVATNSRVGNPVTGGGIWIMGSTDPNFNTPPAGWLKQVGPSLYQNGVALKIKGWDQSVGGSNGFDSVVPILGCNPQFGTPEPCVWIAAATGITIENIAFPNFGQTNYIRIGISSTGSRITGGTSSGIKINNIVGNYGNPEIGVGPCIDVGNGSFWIFLDYIDCGGSGAEIYTPVTNGLVRTNNTVTLTTSTTNDFAVGQITTVLGSTSGTFDGNFTVTAVSGAPQKQVVWSQNGPNETSGGGHIWNERAFAISLNSMGTGTEVSHLQTPSGGVRAIGGPASLQADYLFVDAPFTYEPPLVEFVGNGTGNCVATIKHAEQADVTGNPPAVLAWPGSCAVTLDTAYPFQNFNGITFQPTTHSSLAQTTSPQATGQMGFFNNQVVGQEDAARRLLSPVAARFPNLARTSPSQWGDNGNYGSITHGTLTTVSTAGLIPDGTISTAGDYAATSSSTVYFYMVTQALNVGDWWIGGAWVREPTAPTSNPVLTFGFGAFGIPATGNYCYGGNQQVTSTPWESGNGQWFWLQVSCKVWSSPTTGSIAFGANADSGSHVQIYGPTLVNIPAGTLSDNEVAEFARNLSSYDSGCSQGYVCMLTGQGLQQGGTTFSKLGTPGNGVLIYCSDCTIANPCRSGGTGAFAKRLNGVWVCN